MFTMCVYYRKPEDAETFERRYIDGHLPLIGGYANIKEFSFSKVARKIAGEFPYEYCFVGQWVDKDGWKADMSSPEAAAATEDARSFATQGFDVVTYEGLA